MSKIKRFFSKKKEEAAFKVTLLLLILIIHLHLLTLQLRIGGGMGEGHKLNAPKPEAPTTSSRRKLMFMCRPSGMS